MKVKHKVKVALTEHEFEKKSRELASVCLQINQIDQEARDAAATFRTRLKPLRTERAELADQVNTMKRDIEVMCEELRDPTRKLVVVRRIDTGELVKEIPEKDYDGPLFARGTRVDADDKPGKPRKDKNEGKVEQQQLASGGPFQGKDTKGQVHTITEAQFHTFRKAPGEDAEFYVGGGKQVRLVEVWQVGPEEEGGKKNPLAPPPKADAKSKADERRGKRRRS